MNIFVLLFTPIYTFFGSLIVCLCCHVKNVYRMAVYPVIDRSIERKEPKGTLWQKQNSQKQQAS